MPRRLMSLYHPFIGTSTLAKKRCTVRFNGSGRKLLSIIKAHLHTLFHYFPISLPFLWLPRLPAGAPMGFNRVTSYSQAAPGDQSRPAPISLEAFGMQRRLFGLGHHFCCPCSIFLRYCSARRYKQSRPSKELLQVTFCLTNHQNTCDRSEQCSAFC